MKPIWFAIVIMLGMGACSNPETIKHKRNKGKVDPAVSGSSNCITAPEFSDEMVKEPDIDLFELESMLKAEGLSGWVHAAAKDQQLFVFTYRKGNFFVNVQLPITTMDPIVMMMLPKLRRHDQVVLRGAFVKSQSPLAHIDVTHLEVVTPFSGKAYEYQYRPGVFESIMTGTKLVGKVHIVANGGSVLVVEVEDRVFPVFNPRPELARNLFRNDKIELSYLVRHKPRRPAHLEVDITQANSVCLTERIEEGHGESIELSGSLVMFPQSPQIKFDVFALRTEDEDGVQRNYTLVNFSDFDVFTEIRKKLEQVWESHKGSAIYDRNKFLNKKIIVTAKGTKTVIHPTQANPQILLESADDISFEIK